MYLYCIADNQGYCKFGYSQDPQRRVRDLQTGSSSPLILLHSISVDSSRVVVLEQQLHNTIGQHRRVHGEWFDIDPVLAVNLMEWFRITHVD